MFSTHPNSPVFFPPCSLAKFQRLDDILRGLPESTVEVLDAGAPLGHYLDRLGRVLAEPVWAQAGELLSTVQTLFPTVRRPACFQMWTVASRQRGEAMWEKYLHLATRGGRSYASPGLAPAV